MQDPGQTRDSATEQGVAFMFDPLEDSMQGAGEYSVCAIPACHCDVHLERARFSCFRESCMFNDVDSTG